MKKPALLILGLLLLAFVSIYFIIPQHVKTINTIETDATDINVSKFIVNKRPWLKWWPGQHKAGDSTFFSYNGVNYILQQNTNSSIQVLVKLKDIDLNSTITYASTGEGMCAVTWIAEKQTSINPFTRIAEYWKIKRSAKDIDKILIHFKTFIQKDSNIYGMAVNLGTIKNPIVLATTTNTNEYPATETIYKMINGLRQQIKLQKALQTDSPMLNIYPIDNHNYQVMVAIPINKLVTPATNTVINNLVKGGNILHTKVKGGRYTIANAFSQLKKYQDDHGLRSPAMPYAQLITNRLTQPDTTKWITKVFYHR
jgi:hypothetical protein